VLQAFKALADETRLRIVAVLERGDFNVNELMEILRMGQSRISRHLKILADCQLVNYRRDGTWSYYSLAHPNGDAELSQLTRLALKAASRSSSFESDLHHLESVVQRRRSMSQRYFNRVGSDWERLQSEVLDADYYRQNVLDYLPEGKRSAVDLGAGAGLLLPGLLERFENVIAIDSSQTMLRVAADYVEREQSHDLARCDFRLGELEHLPIVDRSVDAAIACMVLHHVSNPVVAVGEVARILKKDGTFVIADLMQHNIAEMREKYADLWLGFKPAEVKKWLRTTGFTLTKTETLTKNETMKILIFQATKN